jgi:hypothetical protein
MLSYYVDTCYAQVYVTLKCQFLNRIMFPDISVTRYKLVVQAIIEMAGGENNTVALRVRFG